MPDHKICHHKIFIYCDDFFKHLNFLKYLFCSGFRNKFLSTFCMSMALTAQEKMLISIIEFNQRRIEEFLLSRSQSYQMKNVPLQSSNIPVQSSASENKELDTCVGGAGDLSYVVNPDGLIPKILGPAYNKPSVVSKEQLAQNQDKNEANEQLSCQDGIEEGLTVIVDHCVPLPDEINLSDSSSSQPSKEKKMIQELNGVPISESEIMKTASHIPGLGQDSVSSEKVIYSKDSDNLEFQALTNRARNKRNVWIITKNGTRRKKAMSSETDSPVNRNECQPPLKRRRFSSSSSVFDSEIQAASKLSSPSATKSAFELNFNKIETCNEDRSESSTSTNKSTIRGSIKAPLISEKDPVVPAKKKTKILSSPLKRMRQSSPKPKLRSTTVDSSSSNNSLEPYIACWAHCPAISTGVPSAHCVPKRMFIDHLREYHTPPTPINLRNQQIVCICHACETVVPYSYQSKRDHLYQRCTKWHQQFFLFIENAQDSFAIPRFNAPVVKSPGLAGMFKSIAHHPDLDTLTWKNVKNEHFCYHFCGFCNKFVEDSMRAVSDHKATALHRVNVRKSTN